MPNMDNRVNKEDQGLRVEAQQQKRQRDASINMKELRELNHSHNLMVKRPDDVISTL